VQAVASVAAKRFVAAVTRQRDRHVLARELANPVGGNRRAVGIGLVVLPGERIDQAEIVAVHGFDRVPRPIALGHPLRERRLVVHRVVEGDRAGVDRLGRQLRHGGDHRARVDAA
jgi:hypothetical protein